MCHVQVYFVFDKPRETKTKNVGLKKIQRTKVLPRKNKYASNDGKKFNNYLISGVNLCQSSQKASAMQQYVHQQGQPHGCNLGPAKDAKETIV